MARSCTIAAALEVVGERWSLLVIRELFLGSRRFNEIQANTGAPRDILASRLRSLQAAGIVETRRYMERPPRDEYVLAEAGRGLFPVITALREWGERFRPTEGALQFEHSCGSTRHTQMICRDCGEEATFATTHLVSREMEEAPQNLQRLDDGEPPGD